MIQELSTYLQGWQGSLVAVSSIIAILAGVLLSIHIILGRFVSVYHFFTELRISRFNAAMKAIQEHANGYDQEHQFYSEAWQQELFFLTTGVRVGAPFREKLCELAVKVDMSVKELAVVCRSGELKLNDGLLVATPNKGALIFGVFSNLFLAIPLLMFVLLFSSANISPGSSAWVELQFLSLKVIIGLISGGIIGVALRMVIRPFILAKRLKKILDQIKEERI